MSTRLDLRVFLSSPGDVADERALARGVLDRLSQEYGLRKRVHIEEISWDDPGAPVPMDAHLTPQEAIDKRRPKPSDCDIVVVILWARMGTPLPKDHCKPDGTSYVSGTEYEFCEAVAAAKQTGKPSILVYRRIEEPRIGLADRELDEKRRQYQAVETFFAGFTNSDGSLGGSYQSYRSSSEFADRLERELRELVQVRLDALPHRGPTPEAETTALTDQLSEPSRTPAWQGNPYRGLKPFREEHAAIFFGRGRETDELVKRFANPTARIVAVIGASGSGKSSLIGAGLIPRLHKGAFLGSADWVTVRFTPAERGSDPFLNLTRKLAARRPDPSISPEALADTLRADPSAIKRLASDALQGQPVNAELLLFVDQFEELFTARVEEQHRTPFIALIDTIGHSARLRLVLTLRADYYEHCTRDECLAGWLREGSFPLAAPNALALAEMVERPARLAGLEPGAGLIEAILKDVGTEPGALALVEFALAELYERSAGKHLSAEAYRRLGGKERDGQAVSGLGGVIESQTEKTVHDAAGKVDETALLQIFPRLADVDEQGGAVRKRARLDAFGDREQVLVHRLVDERLLVTNKDDANVPWVEVVHEAVLRHWRRFSQWLEANRRFLFWRKRLKVFSDSRSLLRGESLAEALGWLKEHAQDLEPGGERALIDKSHQADRRRRLGGQGAAALALVIATGTGVWWYQEDLCRRPVFHEDDWIAIPPGPFQMGSPDTDEEAGQFEKPSHAVTVKPFKRSRYEVTFEEYDRFADATNRRPPSDAGFGHGSSDEERQRLPVINVSWEDARAYAAWLSEKAGKKLRLPSEAEWEYAARGGSTKQCYWGDKAADACKYANVFDRQHAAELKSRFAITWDIHPCDDDYATLAPVGRFRPNAWGLHDMLGNVWEWVEDCWHDNYEGAPTDGSAWSAWKEKPADCTWRVVRGGSWGGEPGGVRSASRDGGMPGYRDNDLGFRLAQDMD